MDTHLATALSGRCGSNDDDPAETWKSIEGHPGYEVSDLGRVRSLDRVVVYRDGRRYNYPGRILKTPASGRMGYLATGLGRDRVKRVHTLVLTAFVGPRPEGMEACHNDGDPTNNRLDNLRWDTPRNNQRDSVKHGTRRFSGRTHCDRGHQLVEANLVPKSGRHIGHRDCLACSRAESRRPDDVSPSNIDERADFYYAAILETGAVPSASYARIKNEVVA